MRPLLTKMGSAIVVALTSLTYLVFQVTAKTNQIAEFEQQAQLGKITDTARMEGIRGVIDTVSQGQTTGLLLAMVLIPLAFGFVSYLLYQKYYKLDEVKYREICEELDAKRMNQGAK